MAFYIQIYDADGNPEPIANFADILTTLILQKGVGFLCTEEHVERDIRDAVHELFHTQILVVEPPKVTHTCTVCQQAVGVWHTLADGSTYCTACKPVADDE